MKKRLLAAIMSLCMIVSLLPVSAFAVEDSGTPVAAVNSVRTAKDSPVQITKTVSEPDDSGDYTLKLESYVTGKVTSTAPTPMDIVLVLDVSGSMAENFSSTETSTYSPTSDANVTIATNLKWGDNKYYYSPDSTNFYPITAVNVDRRGATYYYTYTYTVNRISHQTKEFRGALRTPDQIYELSTETTRISKMDALKNAVNSFIDATAEQNAQIKDEASKNRIAIVKFAGNKNDDVGNDTYDEWFNTYNCTQIVKTLTTDTSALTEAINALEPGGATAADYGLEFAATALGDKVEGRQQVVLFFTDGEPTHGDEFEDDVAANAVNKAKTMKGNGVTIYTIGVMQGADPSDIEEDINKYMNAVSSNYPSATASSRYGFSVTFGNGSNAGYYKAASNAGDLNNIFQDISESLTPSVDANETSVLKDTVTDAFDLVLDTDGNLDGVTVEKYDYKGPDNWTKDTTFDPNLVQVSVSDDNMVNITGFDYSANAVVTDGDNPQGSKLVVSFKIHPSADYPWQGGKQICFTNSTESGKQAGLYVVDNTDKLTPAEQGTLSDSPSVAITAYQVTYDWGEAPTGLLYDGSGASVTLTLPTDNTYYVAGQTYAVDSTYRQGYTVYTHDEYGNVNGQYTFSGWMLDGQPAAGGAMPQGGVSLTGTWNEKDVPVATHKVTYQWAGDFPPSLTNKVPTDPNSYVQGQPYELVVAAKAFIANGTTYTEGGYTYTFTGWSSTSGTMGDDDVTITGTWTKAQSSFTLTYNANGGYFGDGKDSEKTEPNVAQGPYTLKSTGEYLPQHAVDSNGTAILFVGWADSDSSDADKVYSKGDTLPSGLIVESVTIPDTTTVYAVWGYDTNENNVPDVNETEYSVAYQFAYSGTVPDNKPAEVAAVPTDPGTYLVNNTVTLANVTSSVEDSTNNGVWSFSGWVLDGTTYTAGAQVMLDQKLLTTAQDNTLTFTGTWTFQPNPSDKKITVIFDISGEDCAWKYDSPYEEQKFVVTENGNEAYPIPEVVPTAENKEFVTWKLRDGTTNGTLSGTEFTYATVEQFAVFDENGEATITFVPVLQEKAAPEVESVTLIFDVSSEPDAKWENSHIGHSVWVMLDAAVPTDYAPGVYAEGKEFKYWTSEVGSLGGKQLLTFEEFKAYAIAEKLPIVDGNVTIVYTPVFEKIPEPETPEPPDSNFTLKNAVQIVCTTNGTHGTKDYDLISGRYYALEPTQNVDGTWICDINVISDEYINDFDDSTGTKHELTLPQNGTKTIRLEYNGSKWVPAEDMIPCVFYVECESESEVPDTITVYFDISDAVSENSDVAWTYAYPGYNQPVTLLSDKDDAANAPLVDIPDGWEFVKWDSGANTLDEQGARFTFEDMLEIATPDAKGNWTVTYDLVIQKSGEDPDPEIPSLPDLPTILMDQIAVDCVNGEADHPDKSYGIWNGSYTDSGTEDGVQLGLTGDDKSGWTYTIALNSGAYASKYDEDQGHPTGTHAMYDSNNVLVVLTWDGVKWVVPNSIVVRITCKSDEPQQPDTPDEPDLTTILMDQITVDCVNSDFNHPDKTYGVWDRSYVDSGTEDGVQLGLTGDDKSGWTYTIALNSGAYASKYDEDQGHPTGTHAMYDSNNVLVVLTWDGVKWVVPNNIVVRITCKSDESQQPDTYTVTYNPNGGAITSGSSEIPVEAGQSVPLNATASWDDQHIFLGWSSNGSVKGQVYGAGDQVPKVEEAITPTDDVTVYAIWAEDLNGDKIPDADQIVIRPADITIYTGGTGYEGIVTDEDGSTVTGSEETENGLPEPGYYLVLPYTLNEKLGDNPEEMVDLSNILRFTYGDDRTWNLVRYNDNDNLGSSSAYGYYIYKMVPAVPGQDPVRLQIKDGDTLIPSDEFNFNMDSLFQEYQMSLYTGAVSAGGVKAQLQINGVWTNVDEADANGLCLREGLLTVRGVNEEDVREIESDVSSPVSQITAEADSNVTYYINDSDIPVTNQDGVALLADSLVGEGIDALRAEVQETLGIDENHSFQYKYLDLVDASNGNAYVTLKNDDTVKIHWPMPAGTNANTKFYVVHFDGLDREFDGNSLGDILDSPDVKQIVYSAENGNLSIENGNLVFSTGTFSPFVLVYEDDTTGPVDPDEPGGGESGGGSDSDPTGNLTISKRVSGAAGDREDTFTFTVYLTDEDGDELEANFYYNGSDYSGNIGDGDSITLSGGESITIRNLPVGTRYEVVEEEANEDGYVTTSSGEEGTIRSSQTYTAAFTNTRNAVLATPEETGVDRWLNTDDHIAYLTGYPGDVFGPDNSMTRAEVAQMFYALLRDKNVTITKTFPDVPADAWYATAVNTLASLGMVTGDSNGNFRPNDPITRAEFCVVALAFAYEPASYSCNFSDVARTDWFYPYVAQATVYGWIGGYTDGSFGPRDSITRAQVTTIVNNMLGRAADQDYVIDHQDELVQFVDLNRTHWAYYQIMEAVNAHDYTKTGGSENWR